MDVQVNLSISQTNFMISPLVIPLRCFTSAKIFLEAQKQIVKI